MQRAIRRKHIHRIKKNRSTYWGGNAGSNDVSKGIAVSTPHPCSCASCMNRRKIEGPTLQEKRFDLKNQDY